MQRPDNGTKVVSAVRTTFGSSVTDRNYEQSSDATKKLKKTCIFNSLWRCRQS